MATRASLGLGIGMMKRANRIQTKLETAFEGGSISVEDVSYQHAGHAAMADNNKEDNPETHFNLKIVSSKFEGLKLVKRHRMVYELLSDELCSGLHALSIQAKTPAESESKSISGSDLD